MHVLVLAIYTDDGPWAILQKESRRPFKASSLPGHAPFMSMEEFTVLVEQLIFCRTGK